ncbi:Heat shock transcription factor, Y-linked [Myotis davidii]|uniref:Heat shock transcription factor, Y-linked n=1 Tax=Myotis davidii TaxID=225400 RepID=L5MBZ2_MYODS|nr:Heat shock transcription factor, Y-linked [Myotis davidii]
MANQNTPEMQEAKLAPSDDGQPPIMVQYDTSPDTHVGPREALESQGDQEESPGPSPQDNLQPQDPNQGTANVEGNILLGLSFPIKLWRIVEDEAFSSVCGNDDGDIDENLLQSEILCRRGEEQIFESKSLKSFICLLNCHGFCKICPSNSSVCSAGNRMMIYRNCNFQRGKPWLLENITTPGIAPLQDPDQAEEEHEGSSDNKCSVCEQFKDNEGP